MIDAARILAAAQPLDDMQVEHITYCLRLWHGWSRASSRVASGYSRTSPGFQSYRASRQYDDANGALDDAAEMEHARAVDSALARIPDPWRVALFIEARNIDAPARVWASARIDAAEIQRITDEGRILLWHVLDVSGLLP